jgi:type VI protein secretion system component VasF
MTLEELSEPLFQYVCKINRSVRRGAIPEQNHIHADITGIFDDMRTKAAATPGMLAQYDAEKLELPLMYFVDSTINNSSKLPYAHLWTRLAEQRYDKGRGEEAFWELLEETMKDRSREADERLKVFYTCLGLGFAGIFEDTPDHIKRTMKDIAARLRINRDSGPGGRIVPEAYENVIRKPLELRTDRVVLIVILAIIGMVVVLFVANMVLYRNAISNFTNALNHIVSK